MAHLVLSVCSNGYTVQRDSDVLRSQFYERRPGVEPRQVIFRSIINGLTFIKSIADHDKLSIQTDNLYVYNHIVDDKKTPRTYADEIYNIMRLIDECDARVSVVKVVGSRKTHAERFFKDSLMDVGIEEPETVASAFASFD